MNKKDFTKYINDELEGLTLEQQIKELRKVQEIYLQSLINSRRKKLGEWVPKEQKENYMFCEKCKKYTLIKKCKQQSVKEVRTVMTYIDCGYGDDDKVGNVEYGITYIICPRCGHKQEKSKHYLRKLREWNAR